MMEKLENFVPGIYIGQRTADDGLNLILVKEYGKNSNTRNPLLPLPFSDSGFCSQEEVDNYYKQATYA